MSFKRQLGNNSVCILCIPLPISNRLKNCIYEFHNMQSSICQIQNVANFAVAIVGWGDRNIHSPTRARNPRFFVCLLCFLFFFIFLNEGINREESYLSRICRLSPSNCQGNNTNDSLQWRHNERDGVSNHQPHDCFSRVYPGADQRQHQSCVSLALVRGIHRWPVNSPHKWPASRNMFPFDDVIMCLI